METRKILYVDDENPNLILFKITFRNSLNVLTASSPEEAMEILEKDQDVDVVISDMRMPHTTGLEFISRAKEKYKHPKYCLMTGFDITEEIEKAIDSKVIDNYFKKPFDKNEILNVLNH